MKTWLKRIGIILLFIVCTFLCFLIYDENEEPFEKVKVIYVYDGDTIAVRREGKDVKVRIIGVDTPEVEEGIGRKAKAFTEEWLYPDRTVYLEIGENTTDKYGRTLAYIWLKEDVDTTSFEDFKSYNYSAILLQNTYCRPLVYSPNDKYEDWLEKLNPHNYEK